MGYPLVTVTSNSGILSLSQERFVSDSLENDIPESSLGYTWNIPVFYVNQGRDPWITYHGTVPLLRLINL